MPSICWKIAAADAFFGGILLDHAVGHSATHVHGINLPVERGIWVVEVLEGCRIAAAEFEVNNGRGIALWRHVAVHCCGHGVEADGVVGRDR